MEKMNTDQKFEMMSVEQAQLEADAIAEQVFAQMAVKRESLDSKTTDSKTNLLNSIFQAEKDLIKVETETKIEKKVETKETKVDDSKENKENKETKVELKQESFEEKFRVEGNRVEGNQVEGKRRISHEIVRGYDLSHPYHFGAKQSMVFPQLFQYQVDAFKVSHVRTILFARGGVFRTVGDPNLYWQFVSEIPNVERVQGLHNDLDSFVSDQMLLANIDPLVNKIKNQTRNTLPLFDTQTNWNIGSDLYSIPFPVIAHEYSMSLVHASGQVISTFVWLGALVAVPHLTEPVEKSTNSVKSFLIHRDGKFLVPKAKVEQKVESKVEQKIVSEPRDLRTTVEKPKVDYHVRSCTEYGYNKRERRRVKKINNVIFASVGAALVAAISWAIVRKRRA